MSLNDPPLQPFELANDSQAEWSQAQEVFYIDLMAAKATTRGKDGVCTFSKSEWLDMRKQHYYRWGYKYNLKAFKNKMTSLKERFWEFKKLVEGDGEIRWDPVSKTVVSPHSQWADYVKRNPKAKRFRSKGCPEYKKLELIFGGAATDKMDEHTSDNIPSAPSHTAPVERSCSENAARLEEQDQHRRRSRSPSPSNNTRHESRDSEGSGLSEALKMMAEASQARVAMTNKYTISECIEILDGMGEDVKDSTYMRALKLLQEKGWREAFIRMSLERRKGWLRSVQDGDI